jgi:hypothetical protein
MNEYTAAGQPTTDRRQARRAAKDPGAIVVNVGLKNRHHFARLWPVPKDSNAQAGFLLAMLPLRLLALGTLWATSTPRRLAVPLVLAAGIAVWLLLGRNGHVLHWPHFLAAGR